MCLRYWRCFLDLVSLLVSAKKCIDSFVTYLGFRQFLGKFLKPTTISESVGFRATSVRTIPCAAMQPRYLDRSSAVGNNSRLERGGEMTMTARSILPQQYIEK
jgi:hypothetical protein